MSVSYRIQFLFLLGIVFGIVAHVDAQQSITSATLTGRVVDVNSAAIAGASVRANNLEMNQTTAATTDQDGRFRFPSLRVGEYRFQVERAGFSSVERRITLSLGQTIDLPITLAVTGLAVNVDVQSDTPVIENARSQVAESILPLDIESLPLNGRNYLDLALLVPGVSRTNTGSNQQFAETSAVPGPGISVAGQRNLYNGFIVDGLSANDDAADLAGSFLSQEVIREFQVVTSGGIAEFSRASGGVVNIQTKSGDNNWSGLLYGFFRNQRFDARNPLASKKDLLTQGQYGASVQGPIKKDQSFLFANFEQTRKNNSVVITIPQPGASVINSHLAAVGFKGPLIETGIAPGGFDTSNLFVRVDQRLSDSNQFAVHYSRYSVDARNARNVGGLNTVSRGSGIDNTDQTIYASDVETLSHSAINEARFQYTRSRLLAPINDVTGPAVNISGVANFGTATSSPTARDIDLYELVDNLSVQKGRHAPKGGVDLLYNRVNIEFPGAIQGVYAFSSLNNFLTGNYTNFQKAFGAVSQFQSNPNLGLFVQDEWRPFNNLTINSGLRYDVQFLPEPIRTDRNNFAPRLGLAFSPGDRKTVVRASYGIFYDRIPLRATSNALQRDGSKYITAQFLPSQIGAPTFPNLLDTAPSTLVIKPNVTRIDPNIDPSYSEQASFQVERQVFRSASFSVGYIHLRGLHLILSRNVNVPTATATSGIPNLGRPNPDFGNINRYESSGDSYYDGLLASFNNRFSRWADFRVSYTFSKTIDDSGNFFFSTPQDNFNLRDDRGLSDNDQRHRLTISGSLTGPGSNAHGLHSVLRDLQLSYIFSYASRLPFNVVTGADRNLDSTNNDRPIGVGRNTGNGFDYSSFDLRLSRKLHLSDRIGVELLVEGFNIFNRSNLAIPNNTFGVGKTARPSFGQATSAFDPRQLQFGFKLSL